MKTKPQGDVKIITSEEQLESLTVPNGFKLTDDHIAIELVYDGEEVVFRGEDGELMTMGTLCYLDFALEICIRDILDSREHPSDRSSAEMAHVLGTIIQNLHQQYHAISMHQKTQNLREHGVLESLVKSLTGAESGNAFILGPDGLESVDINDPEVMKRIFPESTDESSDEQSDEDEEIIIGDIPPKR